MSWFRRKKRAMSRGSYDPRLIEQFRKQHQALLYLFDGVAESVEARRFDDLPRKIKRIMALLDEHVTDENDRFYVYLTGYLTEEENSELIDSMKAEMYQIGRRVAAFLHHHVSYGINAANVDRFLAELKDIRGMLEDRIDREESSLYTLYLPPENYGGHG